MAKRILHFPTWRNLCKDSADVARCPVRSCLDPNLLAAVCWVFIDQPEIAWFDLRRDAVVDSTFGAQPRRR